MRTTGVDLSAGPENTALAILEWTATGARVHALLRGVDDTTLIQTISNSDKAGIDCPLGWPEKFRSFVNAHQAGELVLPGQYVSKEWRDGLAFRHTDVFVREKIGRGVLSVSSDRIGRTAMQCAALQAMLASAGRPVDRTGAGPVVEVYPAASLHRWGLRPDGYKTSRNVAVLGELVESLRNAAPWLDLAGYESACRTSDHAFDAVIAALTARAAALGLTEDFDPSRSDLVAVEGWIALPTYSLDALKQ
ncbi:DUF429 domain-containing protein [Catellatospora chokoriensis]|uniref:DUF429 domain-containing protein n=1 Tax=Catellatospora chokoriensis TaxID=310353 RepID=A0A8J3NUR2_9ACTN|nr:DUF429 domain-containing protein [Catellatospora chokoriensis]GIF91505.1 hypothetical protein Cch02nite_49490 [Catellatospora chokoriensis]